MLVLPELHALALVAPHVLFSGALSSVITGARADASKSDPMHVQEVGA